MPHEVNPEQPVSAPGLEERKFDEVRPPLTKDLVEPSPFINQILTRWSSAQPVMDYLRRSVKEGAFNGGFDNGFETAVNLENALAEYQELPIPSRKFHLLAFSMMLRDLLWASSDYMSESEELTGGVTNYHALVNYLTQWVSKRKGERCVVFLSMNYDLLLERALKASFPESDFFGIDSYLAHDWISVLKPHGSVQWGYRAMGQDFALNLDALAHGTESIILAATDGVDETEILIQDSPFHDWSSTMSSQTLMVPAMALPIADKLDFVWPREQEDRLTELLGAVSVLLTIGWSGLDEHIMKRLRPLVRETAEVWVVSGSPKGATSVAENLGRHIDTESIHTVDTGFRQSIEKELRDILL